jgi:hypothetical protein
MISIVCACLLTSLICGIFARYFMSHNSETIATHIITAVEQQHLQQVVVERRLGCQINCQSDLTASVIRKNPVQHRNKIFFCKKTVRYSDFQCSTCPTRLYGDRRGLAFFSTIGAGLELVAIYVGAWLSGKKVALLFK